MNVKIVEALVARAVPRLDKMKVNGLLLFAPANIRGFSGVPLAPSDRLVCALLSVTGEVIVICPAFEAPAADSLPPATRVMTWLEADDPYHVAAEAMALLHMDRGTVLVDEQTWRMVVDRLAAELPNVRFRTDESVIRESRWMKSDSEIETIRRASDRVAEIFPLIQANLTSGISEMELAYRALSRVEGDGSSHFPMVQSGPNAAMPHSMTGRRRVRQNECVVVDYVTTVDGYHGDMTRTFMVGTPTDEMRRAYRAVRVAQRAALAAARPGVTCHAVDRAARSVIEAAGFGEHFTHRLGHGIGLDCHEPPYLVQDNLQLLLPGMCVTVEPGIYVPGKFGIRIEDVIAITSDGCRVLSANAPTDMSAMFDDDQTEHELMSAAE